MNEKPTKWGYLAALAGLLIGTAWTISAWRTHPEEFPYEPLSMAAASLIGLLALFFWKKPEEQDAPVPPSNTGAQIRDAENVVADSTFTAARDIRIGNDSIGQQNIIETQIIQYADGREIPRLLTTPPFNTDVFIGRQPDLDAIESDYQQHNRLLVLVNGEGGIGKTTLAAKYWYAHEARYRHLAWVYSDTGIGAALVTLREVLGVSFDPRDTIEQQVQHVAGALLHLDKPCLLVFDNANDAADLKLYYALLNQLGQCDIHILLTSRVRQVANMNVHAVKPLTEPQAIELFQHYYDGISDEELPLLRDILQAVGYNTLVMEVLAKNLAVSNRFAQRYTLADLLRDLQEKGLLALKNKTVQVMYGSGTLREATPTEIIGAMYDLAQLNEQERYLLSNLSVLPAENIPYTLLNTLLGVDDDGLETPLGSLEEKGWLEYRKEDNSFKISPVVQEVTKSKNAERLLEDCRVLVDTLTTGLNEENRHKENYRQAEVYARMGEVVIHALPPDDDVAILCQNIGNYHRDTGNLGLMMLSYTQMQLFISSLCAKEPHNAKKKDGLAISYEKLGEAHFSLGNIKQALMCFEHYCEIEKFLNSTYPDNPKFKSGLAIAYEKLGSTHLTLGNFEKSLFFFENEHKLYEELISEFSDNERYRAGLGWAYQFLGITQNELGNLDNALTSFKNMANIFEGLSSDFPENLQFKEGVGWANQFLGNISNLQQNLENSLTFFNRMTMVFEELFIRFPNNVRFKDGLAIACSKLGETYLELENYEQSLIFLKRFNILEKELFKNFPNNVRFRNGLSVSYSKLGQFYDKKENMAKAFFYFEKDLEMTVLTYQSSPSNVLFKENLKMSYNNMGYICQKMGKNELAEGYFEKARALGD